MIDPRLIKFVQDFEGLRLKAYKCPAGHWTIGYGHLITNWIGEISLQEAEWFLYQDIIKAAQSVIALVRIPITDYQFAALTDFVFNLGSGNLQRSTLLRRLNDGDLSLAADEFLKWNKARVDGKLISLPGLTRRREAEKRLFETGEYPNL